MDQGDLAAGKKNAARLRAALVFIDESGLLMAPLVRRSWAPRGHPPVLRQRTRSHRKVSIIAALCVSPARDRVRCFFRLHPDTNVSADLIVDFLRHLSRQLRTPLVLVWDRLQAHRGRTVRAYIQETPAVRAVLLPPYAPELDPVEYLWSYLKTNPLANLAPTDLDPLTDAARHHARSLQRNETLLRSFIKHSPLSLRLN